LPYFINSCCKCNDIFLCAKFFAEFFFLYPVEHAVYGVAGSGFRVGAAVSGTTGGGFRVGAAVSGTTGNGFRVGAAIPGTTGVIFRVGKMIPVITGDIFPVGYTKNLMAKMALLVVFGSVGWRGGRV
jgi:hypothetical protein